MTKKPAPSMKRGMDALADAVKTTLGPKGRNVALDKKYGAPTVTHDGVTVARDIELDDPFENMGAQLLKEAATKTEDVAGDGTTTATVLAQAIVTEGLKNVASGANPMQMKVGIDKAAETVAEAIKAAATPVKGHDEIAQVATVSAADPEIGNLIADGDDAVLADLVHDLGDELADLRIGGADGRHLGDLVVTLDRRRGGLDAPRRRSRRPCRCRSSSASGWRPTATFFRPSVTIAWASTVAVVVPSPATSSVLVAASLSSWAPMFSNGSASSMSRATVTPSWMTVGAPYFLSSATLRPLGPSVVLTASASASMPRFIEPRASSS